MYSYPARSIHKIPSLVQSTLPARCQIQTLPDFPKHFDGIAKLYNECFQHGGTNFTAFRIIDTSKPEVKAVIHDIVNKEISQGRMIEMQV